MKRLLPMFCCLVVTGLVLAALSGCSSDRVTTSVPATVRVDKGLVYARYGERVLKLDLYRPANAQAPLPVIVVVAGGGYESVDTEATKVEAVALAKRGLAALAIEYRATYELPFPATVHDVKAAVRWSRANAQHYGLNPDAVGVMGGSYGGLLSSYVAVTAGIAELEGEGGNSGYVSDVYAAVGFSSLTDLPALTKKNKFIKDYLDEKETPDEEKWRFASPITHVSAASPPLLLIAAGKDRGVPVSQSESMAAAYEKAGADVVLKIVPEAIHPFWVFKPWHEATMDTAAAFFLTHVPPAGRVP